MPAFPRDHWVATFIDALTQLRPDIGAKFARTVAGTEYPQQQDKDPQTAAAEWVKRSAGAGRPS